MIQQPYMFHRLAEILSQLIKDNIIYYKLSDSCEIHTNIKLEVHTSNYIAWAAKNSAHSSSEIWGYLSKGFSGYARTSSQAYSSNASKTWRQPKEPRAQDAS